MLDVLQKLNQGLGVRGSMIVTVEGIVIQALLGEELEQDRVAAMSSAVLQETERCLRKLNLGMLSQFVLTAMHGKMVFQDCGPAFLVVLTEKGINLDHTLIEIRGAAFKIKSKTKFED
jgi:predicted regulator of Ras-like GTPase activity (Roadblock/LC7/MglB family)